MGNFLFTAPQVSFEQEEQEQKEHVMVYSTHGCDESKCVSRGFSSIHEGSFTCYADDGVYFPMMCADGFLPVLAQNEPLYKQYDVIPLQYFTCCPPSHITFHEALDASRHCSDPITQDDDERGWGWEPYSICDGQGDRKYPRRMKQSAPEAETEMESFLCCDAGKNFHQTNTNTTAADANEPVASLTTAAVKYPMTFLDETDCVPYRNPWYEPARVENEIGKITVISCDFPDGDFVIPRPVPDPSIPGEYQCCKTGTPMPPFVPDAKFRATMVPVMFLFCLAALVSLVVAVGLLIPLLIQLRNGTYQRTTSKSKSKSKSRSSTSHERTRKSSNSRSSHTAAAGSVLMGHSGHGKSSIHMNSSRDNTQSSAPRKTHRYSTYNLYLVYLALFDLIYSLVQIGLYGTTLDQKFYPSFYGHLVYSTGNDHNPVEAELFFAYVAANLWINAIVCHNVLLLLRTSKSARRINQPSLWRVNCQAGSVLVVSVILGYLFSKVEDALMFNLSREGGFHSVFLRVAFFGLMVVTFLPPMLYVVYISLLIWWKSYIPSVNGATPRAKALRELAFYFFRIVAVFVGVWIPALLCTGFGHSTGMHIGTLLSYCLIAIQPLLTTGVILTKSDARKYILDLVTLSYIFQNKDTANSHHPMGSTSKDVSRSQDMSKSQESDEMGVFQEQHPSALTMSPPTSPPSSNSRQVACFCQPNAYSEAKKAVENAQVDTQVDAQVEGDSIADSTSEFDPAVLADMDDEPVTDDDAELRANDISTKNIEEV